MVQVEIIREHGDIPPRPILVISTGEEAVSIDHRGISRIRWYRQGLKYTMHFEFQDGHFVTIENLSYEDLQRILQVLDEMSIMKYVEISDGKIYTSSDLRAITD